MEREGGKGRMERDDKFRDMMTSRRQCKRWKRERVRERERKSKRERVQ